jgi:hypothetical protein
VLVAAGRGDGGGQSISGSRAGGAEETGLASGEGGGGYSQPRRGELALTFEGEATGGELRADNEIMEARYFPLAELPENIRGHLRQRVADYQAGLERAVVRTQ